MDKNFYNIIKYHKDLYHDVIQETDIFPYIFEETKDLYLSDEDYIGIVYINGFDIEPIVDGEILEYNILYD